MLFIEMNRFGHITISDQENNDVYIQDELDVQYILSALSEEDAQSVNKGYEIETDSDLIYEIFSEARNE